MTETSIPLTPVTGSSMIAADGWDAQTQTLAVRFVNGATYEYRGLSPAVYEAYSSAESKGSYLKKFVEKNVTGVKVS